VVKEAKRISKYEGSLGYWKDSFEAEFKLNGKESADYDKAGHKLAIEIEIKESELPAKDLYFNTYPYKKIKETAKITDDKR
jgi:hypothetical protein